MNHHVVGSFPTPSCTRRIATILSGGQKGSGHPSSKGQCWFPKAKAYSVIEYPLPFQ